jgi:hypothetical protein
MPLPAVTSGRSETSADPPTSAGCSARRARHRSQVGGLVVV